MSTIDPSFFYLKENPKICPIESIYQLAIGLCQSKYFLEAKQLLTDAVKSPAFSKMTKQSKYWILLSEISEAIYDYEQSAQYFSLASKHKSQPFKHILDAFNGFKQRQLIKKQKKNNNNNINYNNNYSKKHIINNNNNNNNQNNENLDEFNRSNSIFSPSPINKKTNSRCTPLTNDLQNSLLRLSSKYNRKTMFKSRKNNNNNNNIINEYDIDNDLSTLFESPEKESLVIEFPPNRNDDDCDSQGIKSKPMRIQVNNNNNNNNKMNINNDSNNNKYGTKIVNTYITTNNVNKKQLGSKIAVSPVRRSIRLLNIEKNNNSNNNETMQQMLKKTNFTFLPNKNLN